MKGEPCIYHHLHPLDGVCTNLTRYVHPYDCLRRGDQRLPERPRPASYRWSNLDTLAKYRRAERLGDDGGQGSELISRIDADERQERGY